MLTAFEKVRLDKIAFLLARKVHGSLQDEHGEIYPSAYSIARRIDLSLAQYFEIEFNSGVLYSIICNLFRRDENAFHIYIRELIDANRYCHKNYRNYTKERITKKEEAQIEKMLMELGLISFHPVKNDLLKLFSDCMKKIVEQVATFLLGVKSYN